MTELNKSAIKSMVLNLRHTLEEDITAVLRQYGLFSDRDWLPNNKVRPERLAYHERMAATMKPEIERIRTAGSKVAQAQRDATRWYIREVAFTYLNRLVGLKCLEVRDLFPETIQTRTIYGGRSLYHRNYLEEHPELVGQADDGLPAMVEAACRDVTQQIRTLFDPDSESSIVMPRYTALRHCIDLINELPLDHWQQDEIVGWIYQFYNAEEKEAIRKRGKPELPIEVAVINQFFTPRWIVKFLVDNTLGRLWLEMYPNSPRVREKCDYLVPEPASEEGEATRNDTSDPSDKRFVLDTESPINNPHAAPRRQPKPPQELRLIDPACGAMHFGYYAIEVFTAIYRDYRDIIDQDGGSSLDDQSIPLAILRYNLYGVDIDMRAVQLAALALYLKARVAMREAGMSDETAKTLDWQVNLVCADARLPGNGMRDEFLREYEDDPVLIQAWQELFSEMQDIAQVGSLLRVEQRFKHILEQHRPKTVKISEQRQQQYMTGFEPTMQQTSFADLPDPIAEWHPRHSLETMLTHLRQFARNALESADVNAQLFATEAEKTLGLLDVLMQEYDVVVMNPPYGESSSVARKYLQNSFPKTHPDVYAAFIERSIDLVGKNSLVGLLVSSTFLYSESFKPLRESIILPKTFIQVLLDLGDKILDAAVDTAALVMKKTNSKNFSQFVRLNQTEGKEESLISYISNTKNLLKSHNSFFMNQQSFKMLPQSQFTYWTSEKLLSIFINFPSVDPTYGSLRNGIKTGADEIFVRQWWEVSQENIGADKKWVHFANGGYYCKYYIDVDTVVLWEKTGKAIAEYVNAKGQKNSSIRPRNIDVYFKKGITYQLISMRGFNAKYLPEGMLFGGVGNTFFPHNEEYIFTILGIFNSSTAQTLLRSLITGRPYPVSSVRKIPFPDPSFFSLSEKIGCLAREAHDLKAAWDTGNEICTRFDKPWLLWEFDKAQSQQHPFDLTDALDALIEQEHTHDTRLQAIQDEIDAAVYDLYEISAEDRALIERELGERPPELVWQQMEGKSDQEKRKEHVQRLLSYFLLQALIAKHDGIILLGEGMSDPTAEQHLRDGLAGLVEDEHALALEDRVVAILGRSLGAWLDRELSKWHTKLYKRRPIIWHLSSERGAFACFVYYHKLDHDTMLKVRNVYLRPILQRIESKAKQAQQQEDLKSASSYEATAEEMRAFDEKLAQVIAGNYNPVIDDGVKKNILPLQEAGVLRHKVV